MKKIIRISAAVLVLILIFCAGYYAAFPKSFKNVNLESKFRILDSYRAYSQNEMALVTSSPDDLYEVWSGVNQNKKEYKVVQIKQHRYFYTYICADDSIPEFHLYSAFGNRTYSWFIKYVGSNFDGYFRSTSVLECGNDYFILEKDGGRSSLFGPFSL